MPSSIFKYLDKYLLTKDKKEFYILYACILALIFSMIYFWFFPSISMALQNQKDSYEHLKSITQNNLSYLKEISQIPKKELSQDFIENQTLIKDIKNHSINNYNLLEIINNLNTALKLQIISDIQNSKENLSFCLQGEFENFMEWLRQLEQNYFIFIQDLHIYPQDDKLVYEIRIKNLGNIQ